MPQNMETLRGATVSTSFSLPISQAAACGSGSPHEVTLQALQPSSEKM